MLRARSRPPSSWATSCWARAPGSGVSSGFGVSADSSGDTGQHLAVDHVDADAGQHGRHVLGDPQLRLPVKGYASHGESWSFALALRLASYDLLRADGDDPILILDDVFAELDTERRGQLADLVSGAEQVLVTAAVAADVPESLTGVRYVVGNGEVTRDG